MGSAFKVTMNEYLPLRDVVFNTLRQAILKGELEPGERLMEIQLAERLGVSRTPIREAIRKLELEGLVLMIPRKGAEVAEISEKSLREVLEDGEVMAIAESDENYHELIYQATANDRLVQILNNLREQMYRYRLEYIKDEDRRQILVVEHEHILRAVRRRDIADAKSAVREHIDNQQLTITKNLTTAKKISKTV